MDYTAVRRTGAQTLTYSTRSGMEIPLMVRLGKILYFSLRKNQLFFCIKNSVFFRVEKSGIFVGRPVLDSGRDSGTAGQLGTARDAGQWTDGLSSMG